MFKTIKKGFAEEVKTYGLFVSLLILISIIFLVIALTIHLFFPSYVSCTLNIAFASMGTFLFSVGLTNRAKRASERAGRR